MPRACTIPRRAVVKRPAVPRMIQLHIGEPVWRKVKIAVVRAQLPIDPDADDPVAARERGAGFLVDFDFVPA